MYTNARIAHAYTHTHVYVYNCVYDSLKGLDVCVYVCEYYYILMDSRDMPNEIYFFIHYLTCAHIHAHTHALFQRQTWSADRLAH
jgi:hypothetical protein